MTHKKNVALITLGCSKNLVDSEQLMRQFEQVQQMMKQLSGKGMRRKLRGMNLPF